MYTEKKIHSGFVGTLFLIATAVLLVFHTLPAQRELAQLQANVASLQEEVKNLSGENPLAASGAAAADTLSEVEQKELQKAIPEHLDQDTIVTDLNKMAKSADVSFSALTFSLNGGESLPGVNVSAGFQGTAADIIRFLKMVEVNPRKFVVKDAGISRAETTGGLELVNLNVTLQAFYRQDR